MAGTTSGKKVTDSSSSGTGKTTTPDFAAILAQLKAGGGSVSGGTIYTQAEADRDVQTIYQQALGRNAAGNDYAKAIGIAMGQDKNTSSYGRQQAVLNWVQNTPEFQTRQDNMYLDGIYKAVAAHVADTKVR
jgi:hypothetical protein